LRRRPIDNSTVASSYCCCYSYRCKGPTRVQVPQTAGYSRTRPVSQPNVVCLPGSTGAGPTEIAFQCPTRSVAAISHPPPPSPMGPLYMSPPSASTEPSISSRPSERVAERQQQKTTRGTSASVLAQ
jgi:hypothetical protein